MQLDPKALIEEAVQASIDAGLAVNGEHGVAAARHAARFMFNALQAVQPVPVAWQTEDEIRAITRAEYKAIQEADSGRGAYLRILYPKPLYSAPLPATASAEPVAWQPIETAPKEQEVLIAYWRWRNSMSPGSVIVQSARQVEYHGDNIWSWVVEDNKHGPFPIRGWCDGDMIGWQSLPAAPVSGADNAK